MQFRVIIALLTCSLTLIGCASSLSQDTYSRDQARRAQDVQLGVVEHVREVQIEGTKSGVGSTAGAVVGGVAGSELGQGKGSIIGSVAGAVVGGLAGAGAEEAVTRQKGLEITVRLESGRVIAVTQAADEPFEVGDRVRVLQDSRGTTRVSH